MSNIPNNFIKKRILACVAVLLLCLCTGCSNEEEPKKDSFQALKSEIDTELEAAKNGKHANLNIVCDEIRLPQNESIQSISFPVYTFMKQMTLEEKLDFYKDVVFPGLYDVETANGSYIVDFNSEKIENGKEYYTSDYDYMLEHGDELEEAPVIGYYNAEGFQYMETFPEGVCVNMSHGKLGSMFQTDSPFLGCEWEEVKSYNCYLDDLSDSYLLVDGEKTVAEAKAEIESYLDAHYPMTREDNGIRNEVYEISVRKIPDTEYYVFNAYRTLSYNGIRVKEQQNGWLPSEVGVMGEAVLCESNKVDILRGFVNCFSQGSVIKTYEEFIPFAEVMEQLSYYLTDETVFDIGYIGLEYRMFTEVVDEVTYYNWVPYWCFLAENPNDDSVLRIYMNIETGEMDSYKI